MSKLAEIRKSLGISQTVVGQQLGVPKTSVSDWENGRNIPPKHIKRLSRMLNVTEAELLSDQPRVETRYDRSALDSALEAVMRSELAPDVKVQVYEIISSVKKQKVEQPQPETHVVSYPEREDTLEITKGSAERTADIQKALVAYCEDDHMHHTTTPRGKISGNKMLNHQVRCPSCESLFYVPKVSLKKKMACPFCGQHIIIK